MKFLLNFLPLEIIRIIEGFLVEKEKYNKIINSFNLIPEYNCLKHERGVSHDFSFYRQKYKYGVCFSDIKNLNYKKMLNKAIYMNQNQIIN